MIVRVSFVVVALVSVVVASRKKLNASANRSENNGSTSQESKESVSILVVPYLPANDPSVVEIATSAEARMGENMKPNIDGKIGSTGESEFRVQDEKLNNENEADVLSYMEKEYSERKEGLERKLFELYGLKEQKAYIAHMQKNLQKNIAEIDMLNELICSLHVERRELEKKIEVGLIEKRKLEIAKKMIEKMQRKIDADASHIKGQLGMIQEQVFGFESKEFARRGVKEKFIDTKGVEMEILKLRRETKEIELEKRDLMVKLVAE